ncbi:MAG: TIGR04013 family B12-binding domain/radical SAM domain-containing protein, partial [Actinomycetota bacterium]|nr:TIGR04013 family B12-binding domain/radical SAM domain-containing protein [Actinomycetota bacterium]
FLGARNQEALINSINGLAEKYDQVLLCFSFATTNVASVYSQVSSIRSRLADLNNLNIVYIAGGPHSTGDPDGTLSLGFDVAVIGEAEETLPEIASSFLGSSEWRQIRGIAYKQNGNIVRTKKRKPINLNDFAPFSVAHNRLSPIEISRGCPYACYFCQTSFIFGTKMRHRSVEEILKYISLSKSKGTRDFRFISPNALAYGSEDGKTVNLKAIESLLKNASEITGKKHLFFGSFPSEVRPEALSKDALDLITRYTATKQLVIGAQTGSQRMLELLHRQHTAEDIYNAVNLIRKANLKAVVDFIFGLPGETEEDRRLSIKMIDNLTKAGAIIHSHTFIPLPGTPLAKCDAGVVSKDLSAYLSKLANKGLQFGQWKKQEEMAREVTGFRQKIGSKSASSACLDQSLF